MIEFEFRGRRTSRRTARQEPMHEFAIACDRVLMIDSGRERFARVIFYVLILLFGYLTYLVISPFLAPLAWATVFAIMFYGVHSH